MAKKGCRKSQKRFAASKTRFQEAKWGKWGIMSIPGAFDKESSIPLGFLLRDLLNLGRNLREVKIALNEGKVLVNGRARRNYRFPVGFFDIVTVDGLKSDYRVVFDLKGRLAVKEIEKKPRKSKLCRIEDKKTAKKGSIQLISNDGRSVFVRKDAYSVGDSIEIEVPSQKVLKTLRLEKGAKAFIVGGKHAGEEAFVREIKPGSMKSARLVVLKAGSREFQTTSNNVFIVGERK